VWTCELVPDETSSQLAAAILHTHAKPTDASRARARGSAGIFLSESGVNYHHIGLLAVAGTLATTFESLSWPDCASGLCVARMYARDQHLTHVHKYAKLNLENIPPFTPPALARGQPSFKLF
jgi:hypothetical protein